MKIILAAALLLQTFCIAAFAQQPGADASDNKQAPEYAVKPKYSRSQAENWDTRLKRISGDVFVKPAGVEEWSKIEGHIPLDQQDSVKTGSDGIAEIYLDDKGAMTLGRNTEFEVSSTKLSDSVFTLKLGSIAAKIQHFLNEKLKMEVRTPAAVCAVRGTEFAVEYYQLGKETSVAVYDEGKVAVSTFDAKGEAVWEYTLEKNTELTFKPLQKRFRPAAISKMARYRTGVADMRKRITTLKKTWLPVSQANRSALRDQALKRRVMRNQIKSSGLKSGVKGRAGKAAARRKARQERQ
ncbi:MAG: hypothetical protein A2X34_06315 [Elusimicrobia bacterium GWC2_51_8]|nr:MAG: hypothetical protein A2X33_02685 [Elusimicrobia bacterium GWA2_51_34]OGR65786.1 MAG: hypothetical protein A2X34_06315 [Elusimicrobia bacterium GWC2_51_8]OGR87807.1 MAG: hypothetical protein A2021_04775 [Elusimicrobia bacterium GWF2_52_66]HAF94716.1 hypothetical protein [Elusimicrobiota bacterium]HCE97721.1 hypothetical protein [Elusimicrobiota bacterium]